MTEPAPSDVKTVLTSVDLTEDLAAVEHERWSDWQRYMHGKCTRNPDGSLTIPADLARRWATQSDTHYDDLSESEKQSDRDQVARYIPLIADALTRMNQSRGEQT